MHNKEEIHLKAENLTNTASNVSREEFLQQMRMMHPTMQQLFAGLVLSWMKDYAENYPVNGRNQDSIEECRELLDAFDKFNARHLRTKFPLI